MNIKNLLIGIFFLLLAACTVVRLFTHGAVSYNIVGLVLFCFVGIAFLRRVRS